MKRRSFINKMGMLGVAMVASKQLTACTFDTLSASQAPIGLQLFTLRNVIRKDVKATLRMVAEAGYSMIEPYGYSSKKGFWGLKPDAFLGLLNEFNLKATSGHYDPFSYLATGDTKELEMAIEAAATLKSDFFTIPSLNQKLIKNMDGYKKMALGINKIAEMTKKAGMSTAYHNHKFEFATTNGQTQTGYDILLKETDKDLVKFEMDLFWVINAGKDPIQMFNENPGRFALWHVKDIDHQNKNLNANIGLGTIDFKAIFEKSALSGMKYFFVEQENNYKPNEMGSIKNSAEFLRKNILLDN